MVHSAVTCPCDLLLSLWNRIYLDGYTTVYVSIHAVMGIWDFFWGSSCQEECFEHWSKSINGQLGEGNGTPTPVLLPGKSHGWRSLEGSSLWGREQSETTETPHFHFSLSCIEGNGNPLQCSCLENPRDGGAWWAAIYGVAQSRTQLNWLSSSSSSSTKSLDDKQNI